MVEFAFVWIVEDKFCEGRRKVNQRVVEVWSKSQTQERGGEVVNRMVEVLPEREVRDTTGEMVNLLIESI